MKKSGKTVLVFGTFDGLHDGHRFFLKGARRLGNCLIASVAADGVIAQIKKHSPTHPLNERLQQLKASKLVDKAVAGDMTLGNWSAIKKWKPDIVALGYDQTVLETKLREHLRKERLPITIIKIAPHEPNRLHSHLLRGK